MRQSKAPYPSAFREQILELIQAGKSVKELSKEFDCCPKTILSWVAQASIAQAPKSSIKAGLNTAEGEELSRLRRQVRQLQMERDILAKATAWFAAKGEKLHTPSSSS
ncbi:MAG: transposase [Glomeribacter sp. 1016415]|nr:transposase [Glomeribacter sp. 1016415]